MLVPPREPSWKHLPGMGRRCRRESSSDRAMTGCMDAASYRGNPRSATGRRAVPPIARLRVPFIESRENRPAAEVRRHIVPSSRAQGRGWRFRAVRRKATAGTPTSVAEGWSSSKRAPIGRQRPRGPVPDRRRDHRAGLVDPRRSGRPPARLSRRSCGSHGSSGTPISGPSRSPTIGSRPPLRLGLDAADDVFMVSLLPRAREAAGSRRRRPAHAPDVDEAFSLDGLCRVATPGGTRGDQERGRRRHPTAGAGTCGHPPPGRLRPSDPMNRTKP